MAVRQPLVRVGGKLRQLPAGDILAGACTAWVNFNGTGTVAIRDAYNVSGLVDNGAGDYSLMIPAGVLANTNFSLGGTARTSGTRGGALALYDGDVKTTTLVQVRVASMAGNGVLVADASEVNVQIFGGK